MAGHLVLRTFVLFEFSATFALSCHLAYNIIGIQAARGDQYEISCGQRALPICPKVCSWTNQTCEEYATRRHWNKKRVIVTNMTFSYPLKASGRMRDDAAGVKSKSLHRRCCLSDNVEATKCKSIVWNVDRPKGKFDVLASADSALKCPTKNAYIRDIRQGGGIQRTFNLDICCLNYAKDHDERVFCRAPKNGETKAGVEAAATIALAVSLPLALGIGIPLLFQVCGAKKSVNGIGYCSAGLTQIEGTSSDECCALCVAQNYDACVWDGTGPYCYTCRGPFTISNDPQILYIP